MACHRTKRIVRDTCAGLIKLPHFNPTWSQEKQINSFCCGKVYVHKSVKDFLFNKESLRKVWFGIEPSLLIPAHLQRVAFCFHLLKVDDTTRHQATPSSCRYDRTSLLIGLLKLFLETVYRGEECGKLNLSLTWLSLFDELVKIKTSCLSRRVEIYDCIVIPSK